MNKKMFLVGALVFNVMLSNAGVMTTWMIFKIFGH